MMNQYETVFILTPVLSAEQKNGSGELLGGVLTYNYAVVLNDENCVLIKLAYPIEKKSTGFYILFEFKAEPTLIQQLETEYRRDERVIRFITVKMEKYAAQYAEKRRNKKEKKEEERKKKRTKRGKKGAAKKKK